MVAMVTNTMDLVAGVSQSNNLQNKNISENSFDEILSQHSEEQSREKDVKKPTREIKTTNTSKVKKSTKKKEDTEEITSSVDLNKLQEDVVKKITEILGITEEELNQILSELNMTALDLLSPDNLNTFLTTLFNVDDTFELLSMPNVIDNIKELKTELNNLTESLDLNTEEIKNIINKVHSNEVIKTENEVTQTQAISEDSGSNTESQLPQIEITDERTDKDNTPQNTETKALDNQGLENVTNVVVDQNIQKVEVIGENGIKEVVTYNVNTEEVIDQIVSSVKVNLNDDTNTMFIQLRPEHLGKLSFALTSEQGVVTANFMAENPAVKELIESNLAQLRVSLEQQGINVDKLEVDVADSNMFSQDSDSNQFTNNNNKKRRAAKMMNIAGLNADEEVIDEEINESSLLQAEGTSMVDYSV